MNSPHQTVYDLAIAAGSSTSEATTLALEAYRTDKETMTEYAYKLVRILQDAGLPRTLVQAHTDAALAQRWPHLSDLARSLAVVNATDYTR